MNSWQLMAIDSPHEFTFINTDREDSVLLMLECKREGQPWQFTFNSTGGIPFSLVVDTVKAFAPQECTWGFEHDRGYACVFEQEFGQGITELLDYMHSVCEEVI